MFGPIAGTAQQHGSGQPGAPGATVQTSENYVIRPLDGLRFRIIGEPETVTDVRVSADGSVNLPYVGRVSVGGQTVHEARKQLFTLYDSDWYVDPQIDLTVIAYAQRRVQVLGKVARQGVVLLRPEEELTLLNAIAEAGGWSPDNLARKNGVVLRRIGTDGQSEEFVIDTTSIGPNDWPLQDGDVIDVPERRF